MILRKIKNVWKRVSSNITIRQEIKKKTNIKKSNSIVLIDTSAHSDNLGDNIIMHYIQKNLNDIISCEDCYRVASHTYPSDKDIEEMQKARYVLVCGTNILSPQMELYSGWRFDKRMIHLDNIILVGVGWWGYKNADAYSRFVYRNILASEILHSARDEETTDKLHSIGIQNVINTNCLTMWGLNNNSPFIPTKKCDKVIFTVTAVMHDPEADKRMINILKEKYKTLYFWPQGDTDLEHLKNICGTDNIVILDRTLKAYTDLLENEEVDYVGSRLHGGVHALHHNKRTIIIAVDNRATEMARDTGLPVIKSSEIGSRLPEMIDSQWETRISLNEDAAVKWKKALVKKLKQKAGN